MARLPTELQKPDVQKSDVQTTDVPLMNRIRAAFHGRRGRVVQTVASAEGAAFGAKVKFRFERVSTDLDRENCDEGK